MTTITSIDQNDQITSSRADINSNFANLNSDKIETSVIDTDTTLAANSDDKIPSQKAVKAYVDAGGDPDAPTGWVSTSAGGADSGKAIKLNAQGVLDGSAIPQLFFGDGSDGDATISSGTTTLTKDMYYNNLTVNGTGILKTAGYRVFVKGTLTVDGTSGASINNGGGNGGNAQAGTPQTGGTAGSASATGFFAGGVIGKAGANGVGGSSGPSAAGTAGTAGTASGAYALNTTAGSSGGNGGGGYGGTSGGAGGAVTSSSVTKPFALTNIPCVEITGTTTLTLTRQNVAASGGSGGSGDAAASGGQPAWSGAGGGSGGSGGIVYIFTYKANLTGTGCINANGGNGGNGGNGSGGSGGWAGGGGGGAGGNGGVVIFGYYQKTGTGTVTSNGGTGGTKGTGTGTSIYNGTDGTNGANGLVITFNTSA